MNCSSNNETNKEVGRPAAFERIRDFECCEGQEEEVVEKEHAFVGQTMRMPAKLHDGGTPTVAPSKNANKPDAFLRYSDDNVRMHYLLGIPQEAGTANEENERATRKTRLSTELHPDMFIDMLFGVEGAMRAILRLRDDAEGSLMQ